MTKFTFYSAIHSEKSHHFALIYAITWRSYENNFEFNQFSYSLFWYHSRWVHNWFIQIWSISWSFIWKKLEWSWPQFYQLIDVWKLQQYVLIMSTQFSLKDKFIVKNCIFKVFLWPVIIVELETHRIIQINDFVQRCMTFLWLIIH